MTTRNFQKFAGWTAILSAVLFGISIVGMLQYLQGNLEDVPSFVANMANHKTQMLLYGWPGLAATILMLPLFYISHRRNKSFKEISNVVFNISLIGIVFVSIGYLFHLALTYFHVPIYQSLSPEQQLAFNASIPATIGLQDMFWISGDLFAFLGIAGLLALNWKDSLTPKWLIILVIISGLSAAIGSFSFIPAFKTNMVLGMLFMVGFAVYAVWQILIGIYLIRVK